MPGVQREGGGVGLSGLALEAFEPAESFLEALTNVVRHGARSCVARLSISDVVALEVRDDGAGISREYTTAGVGLLSMCERAAELGGKCSIEPAPEGGTQVLVRLPLAKGA